MNRVLAIFGAASWLTLGVFALAQQAQPQPPAAPLRVEAKREVVVNWTLGDQSWNFKDILAAYEPIRGYVEPRDNPPGNLAVWKLRAVRDLEEGAVRLHEQMRGSPFRIVLLDGERTVINADAVAQITAPSGRMGDTIELLVALPEMQQLRDVKSIRVERRTDVGF